MNFETALLFVLCLLALCVLFLEVRTRHFYQRLDDLERKVSAAAHLRAQAKEEKP